MPANKSQPKKAAQNYTKSSKAALTRARVVKGVIEGKKEKEIAAEVGLSRDRVAQIKAEPETKSLIQSLLDKHSEQLGRIQKKALDSIEQRMTAPRISQFGFVVKDPATGQAYPDAPAQSGAVRDYLALIELTMPKKEEEKGNTYLQLNQLVQIAQIYQQQNGGSQR